MLLLSQQLTWEELFEEMNRENRSFDGLEGVDSAVAEVTGATLLTRDARLARAAGHRARVELV